MRLQNAGLERLEFIIAPSNTGLMVHFAPFILVAINSSTSRRMKPPNSARTITGAILEKGLGSETVQRRLAGKRSVKDTAGWNRFTPDSTAPRLRSISRP